MDALTDTLCLFGASVKWKTFKHCSDCDEMPPLFRINIESVGSDVAKSKTPSSCPGSPVWGRLEISAGESWPVCAADSDQTSAHWLWLAHTPLVPALILDPHSAPWPLRATMAAVISLPGRADNDSGWKIQAFFCSFAVSSL